MEAFLTENKHTIFIHNVPRTKNKAPKRKKTNKNEQNEKLREITKTNER